MQIATPLILAVALFMEMMDATVIATSLPAIADDIGAEPIALKLAMTAYLVSLAMFIPLSGWAADKFGAKNVFRWAIFVFMLGSIACALSNSMETFVASRFFQGMGGSMMTPLARLVLVRATPKKDLISAMMWLALPALIGPLLGPPIGGFLTTFFSWEWIFWINVPIGIAGIIASTIFLPEIERGELKPVDWTAFSLISFAFSGMLFGLSVISLPALPPWVGAVVLVAGMISMYAYVRVARTSPNPPLDPRIFRHRDFTLVSISSFLFRVAMGVTPFLLPLMLQLGFGFTPFETGLVMLFGAAGAISVKPFVKRFYKWLGFRNIAILTSILSTLVFIVSGFFQNNTPIWAMMATMYGAGFARSAYFTGMNALLFGDVDKEEVAQASSIFAVSVQLGLACGVALVGIILELRVIFSHAELSTADFQFAFFIVAIFSVLAYIPVFKISKTSGLEISGYQPKNRPVQAVGNGN